MCVCEIFRRVNLHLVQRNIALIENYFVTKYYSLELGGIEKILLLRELPKQRKTSKIIIT